jgi:hypothetical protein
VDIADPETHRCLSYIAAVQRQGYRLTYLELSRYAQGPRRGPVPTATEALRTFVRSWQRLPGEFVTAYLWRVDWIHVYGEGEEFHDEDHIEVTPLGRAVLAALDEGTRDDELSTAIVLDRDDPIGRATVISEIAQPAKARSSTATSRPTTFSRSSIARKLCAF